MRHLLPLNPLVALRPAPSWGTCVRCKGGARRRYALAASQTYDDAIAVLNTLQTPHKVLQERVLAGIRIDDAPNKEMRRSLARIGYSQKDLDKLNIIHVAGTKGKGTTCSYVDSILSHYRRSHDIPLKVGLFTSPHLIAVRERIRINSTPISATLFAKYFFEVWDALRGTSGEPVTPPVYFRYLTLMSYHVFLREGVNTAIYEVGVGGEYDSTNIVDRPTVTGISTLGIDHTFTLGETIGEIAWHKAGIQKPGVPSFTVTQLPAAMEVILKRSKERGVKSLGVVDQDQRLDKVRIQPDANFQKTNASLAVALASTALKTLDSSFQLPSDSLPKAFVDGLEQGVWRGRCERKLEGNITWYLDGAHTADSITIASRWFGEESSSRPGTRVLIFNQQGHREAIQLLETLFASITAQGLVRFDHVVFCTSTGLQKDFASAANDSAAIASLTLQKAFAEKWHAMDPSPSTIIKVLPRVEDAFAYVRELDLKINEGRREEKTVTHALVTGSLHLVGRALGVLEGVDAL